MIHWLDEPIIHSVLSGLLFVGIWGALWAIYVRVWQLYIWTQCGSAISAALSHGYEISSHWFSPVIGLAMGDCTLVWKGGLFGEQMFVAEQKRAWITTEEDLLQIL